MPGSRYCWWQLPSRNQQCAGALSIVGTVEFVRRCSRALPSFTNTATGVAREFRSAGSYTAVSMPAGTYDMSVTLSGFRTLTRTGIVVTINNVTRVNASLEVGQVTDQVTVTASAVALQTDRSDTTSEISARTVVELPLASYRNYQSMINLVPGATPAAFQNSVGASPQRSLTTNINGTNRNNNNTRVDGAINVYIWLPHHTLYNPPVESIETVNISTSSFDAEQGMAGGAAVTVATKSGTNELHGSAYWYHDNQHLYARPYFYRQSTPKPTLSKSIVNIPGGRLAARSLRTNSFTFSATSALPSAPASSRTPALRPPTCGPGISRPMPAWATFTIPLPASRAVRAVCSS